MLRWGTAFGLSSALNLFLPRLRASSNICVPLLPCVPQTWGFVIETASTWLPGKLLSLLGKLFTSFGRERPGPPRTLCSIFDIKNTK